jgi:hypothetical protein
MWRWIAANWENMASISLLKSQWLSENGFLSITWDCFFCEWAFSKEDNNVTCENCPGALVDKNFRCINDEFYWREKPEEFYRELLRLNRIRKAGGIIERE